MSLVSFSDSLTHLTSDVGLVNSSLHQAVIEVSKMPGPPGDTGQQVGDYYGMYCVYSEKTLSYF